MNFIVVHTNNTHDILLNIETISHIQSINEGRSTRIALCRGDDLFVSDKYDDIVAKLRSMSNVVVNQI